MNEPQLAELLDRARTFVQDSKYLHAIQLYRRVIQAAPFLDVAWIELAEAYLRLNKFDAAEQALLEARDRTSDRATLTFMLGQLNLKRQHYGRALTFYHELLEVERMLSPQLRTHLLFHVGLVHSFRNNVRLAEEHFRRVLRIDPQYPKIGETIAELLLRRGVVAEAIELLQNAITINPHSGVAHYLLGLAYKRTHDWKKAYEEFETALDLDPNEPTTWQLCGEVLLALQQLDEAEHYLRHALELNPDLTDAIAAFGMIYLRRGDVRRAKEHFERALHLDPHHPAALIGKAELSALSRRRSS